MQDFYGELDTKDWLHITLPLTNGLAERAVQSFKRSIEKNTEGSISTQVSRFLFLYRRTPHTTTGMPPAQMLFGKIPDMATTQAQHITVCQGQTKFAADCMMSMPNHEFSLQEIQFLAPETPQPSTTSEPRASTQQSTQNVPPPTRLTYGPNFEPRTLT